MSKYTAFIFARGGSKGVKNKNIRMAGDKPLIGHAIDSAKSSARIARVVVSTDSEDIAEVAREYGADILMRPPELAADDTPEMLAWRHAIDSLPEAFAGENPLFISIPSTSPLRTGEDIDNAIARFEATDCDVVFGISPAQSNPYFTMVTIGEDDLIHICMEGSTATRRQDIPPVYDIVGCVYVTTPEYVQSCTRLIDGRVGYFMVPPERAVDVDTEYDLHMVDLMLKYPFKGES